MEFNYAGVTTDDNPLRPHCWTCFLSVSFPPFFSRDVYSRVTNGVLVSWFKNPFIYLVVGFSGAILLLSCARGLEVVGDFSVSNHTPFLISRSRFDQYEAAILCFLETFWRMDGVLSAGGCRTGQC